MKIWMKANVQWIPYEKGGRQNPLPENTRYCPMIVFSDEKTAESWSAEIYIIQTNKNNESTIKVSFLSPNAPFRLLKPGAQFELYEGRKYVAQGIIKETV